MATQREKADGKTSLLSKMYFAPEARVSDTKPPEIKGRFRYFGAMWKKNSSYMLLVNLLFLVTALPLMAAIFFPRIVGGMESFAYMLKGVEKIPYFLGDFGFGASVSQTIASGEMYIQQAYQIFFCMIAAGVIFLSFGFAGMMHVGMKFVWQDTFTTKKDKYGNNVPRAVIEFFRGIKKHWLQMLIVYTVAALVFAGVANAVVYFNMCFIQGTAGAGQWILVFLAAVIGLAGAVYLIFLPPIIVEYDIPFVQKLKNATILTLSMFLPTLFLLAIVALPFIAFGLTSNIVSIIVAAVIIVFGAPLFCFADCIYSQYYADKIVTPVYESQKIKEQRKLKKKEKKQKASNQKRR